MVVVLRGRPALLWGSAFLWLSTGLMSCAVPNALDEGPLAPHVVNDRWVHPDGWFTFRLSSGRYALVGQAEESLTELGGSLRVLRWSPGRFCLLWGLDAMQSPKTILEEIQRRSPGAAWVHHEAVDVDGQPGQFSAAWVPKPGANKGGSSIFGFASLDTFNLFIRFQYGTHSYLLAAEKRVSQSAWEKKAAEATFDFVAEFMEEIEEHVAEMVMYANAVSFDDPVLAAQLR